MTALVIQRLERRLLVGIVMAAVFLGLVETLPAQYREGACVLTYYGETQNRVVRRNGHLTAECGGPHDGPFGNWGVTSNFGHKYDGNQYPGWEPGRATFSRLRIHYWNTCTNKWEYRAPNREFYNDPDSGFTAQRSTEGVARHGIIHYRHPISCRNSTGCASIDGWSVSTINNFMTIYEMDFPDRDDLLTSLYFRDAPIILDCANLQCRSTYSAWQEPYFSTNPRTHIGTQFRARVRGYLDDSGCARPR